MKLPAILTKLMPKGKAKPRQPQQATLRANTTTMKATVRATARRADMAGDMESEEPTTRLSSAFIVVLILHVVAVGGIYLFNGIKAHRRGGDEASSTVTAKNDAATPAVNPPAQKSDQPAQKNTPEKLPPAPQPPSQLQPAAGQLMVLPSGARVHRVQAGENLTKIATTYGITVADLEEANNLGKNAVLKPGQPLNIPGQKSAAKQPGADVRKSDSAAATPAADKGGAAKTYIVKKGDTATSIAKQFGVSAADLLKANEIGDPTKMQLGQSLKIPAKKIK